MSLKIVFIGCIEFSRHCLKEVVENHGDVRGIFTLPAGKAGFHADYSDLTPLADQYGIPIHYIRDINDKSTVERIQAYEPDILFVFGWSQLIKRKVLGVPRLGSVGSHPAILPRNRGRHPLVWTIALGLKQAGMTFFWLSEGADDGPILAQKVFKVSEKDDASTLYQKIESAATKLIKDFLPKLTRNEIVRLNQDHSQANYWRKRGPRDGCIDFRMSSFSIDRLVRALTKPYVGAHVEFQGQEIKVWKSRIEALVSGIDNLEPGKVLKVIEGEIWVRSDDGVTVLMDHEFSELPAVGKYIR